MCKNTILNAAIDTALDLPRKALWTATAVVAVFSLEAGLGIIGDSVDLKGTTAQAATPGDFVNANPTTVTSNTIYLFGEAPPARLTATWFSGTIPTPMNGVTGGGQQNPIIYASELFGSTLTNGIPSPTDDYQLVKYTISGAIIKPFTVAFTLSAGSTFKSAYLGIDNGTAQVAVACDTLKSSSTTGTYTITPEAGSCSIPDGTQLYLAFKLATADLATAGNEVKMTATFSRSGTPEIPNPARTVVVAKSAKAADVSIETELGGLVYVGVAGGRKDFVSNDAPGSTAQTAYVATDEVQIGYLKIASSKAVDASGSNIFTIGKKSTPSGSTTAVEDTATLTIENGQFAASPGGTSAGRVFLDINTGSAIPATSIADGKTATWTLNYTQLDQLARNTILGTTPTDKTGWAPIKVRVDGVTTINDTEGGNDPQANVILKLNGSVNSASVKEIEAASPLRRIPPDGKTCWVYNIPPPLGKDVLSLRITNDSDLPGTITGTLYGEDGTTHFESVNLLETHVDYTKPGPDGKLGVPRTTGSELLPRETVILSVKNITDLPGAPADWPKERKVLEIRSTIPKLEVLNLLRYVVDVQNQPMSNISAGVTGVACTPVP